MDYFWQKVEEADDFRGKDDVLMTKLFEDCLTELYLNNDLPRDSDFYHLLGYIYYSMRPQRFAEAQRDFKRAIELDASNTYSKLYLGHTYYDSGDYQNALKCFSDIEANSLPDLLMMKAEEMIVCSLYHDYPDQAEKELQKFLRKFAPLDYLDDYPFVLRDLLERDGRSLETESTAQLTK